MEDPLAPLDVHVLPAVAVAEEPAGDDLGEIVDVFLEAAFVSEATGPVRNRLAGSFVLEHPHLAEVVSQVEVNAASVVEEWAIALIWGVSARVPGPVHGRSRGWAASASPALGVGAFDAGW